MGLGKEPQHYLETKCGACLTFMQCREQDADRASSSILQLLRLAVRLEKCF
jgi:hypothetical protein